MTAKFLEDEIGLDEALKVMERRAKEALEARPDRAVETHRDIEAMINRLYKGVLPVTTKPSGGGDPEPVPNAGKLQQAIGVLMPWAGNLRNEIQDWPSVLLRQQFETARRLPRESSSALDALRQDVAKVLGTWTDKRRKFDEQLQKAQAVHGSDGWAASHVLVQFHVDDLERLLGEIDAAIEAVPSPRR